MYIFMTVSQWRWISPIYHQLPETHWSGWWMQTLFFPCETMATEIAAETLRSGRFMCSEFVEGATNRFPHEARCLTWTQSRVYLLLSKGHSCYSPRRNGYKKHKSSPGCIMVENRSVLNLVIVNTGEEADPRRTDTTEPQEVGPQRASRIQKLLILS